MGPYPPQTTLTIEQVNQFNHIVDSTNKIVNDHGFHIFDRRLCWEQIKYDLLLPNSHHFSPQGVRIFTEMLAEIIARKWHRPFHIRKQLLSTFIPMRPTPLQVQEQSSTFYRQSSQRLKWSNTRIKSNHRYNPLNN